ncbi:MAG TPA: COX aromatic rich motif-containing protein [Candidatus Acidoferrum sp.]|nr:COX aromatic rich motif-containing protein [Candidatus Acidoferrum sp.]
MDKLLAFLNKIPVFKLLIPVYVGLAIVFGALIVNGKMQLFYSAGYIADIQSQVLWGALFFAVIVGGLLVASFFFVVFRFKEGAKRTYTPDWTAGKWLHLLAWGVPLLAVAAISVMIWNTSHMIDPYQAISSSKKPVTIQVVAERWKWLFLYPNDGIATVNTMEIPVGVPINLQLTADAPMNSFWVPSLAGQVYAMTGMVTQLHLEADKPGSYPGSSAEISGDGFAGMEFTVKAISASDYSTWKANARMRRLRMDSAVYATFAMPSSYNSPTTYKLTNPNLFNEIVMKFMTPTDNSLKTPTASPTPDPSKAMPGMSM